MPHPADLQTQPGSSLSFKWAIYTSPQGYAGGANYSWMGGTQLVETLDVEWDAYADGDALKEILGYAEKASAGGGNFRLSRFLPMQHPQRNTLWATRISQVKGVRWNEKVDEIAGPYSEYDRARLTVVFEALPFNVIDDTTLDSKYSGNEWRRYTYIERMPRVEAINRLAGQAVWAEGASGGPTVNDPVQFGTSQVLSKEDIKLIWYQVPQAYLMDSERRATKVRAALGKLNDDTFLGEPAGTLLFDSVKITPEPAPFPVLGLAAWEPQVAWRVEMNLKWFDPPYNSGAGNTTRGHNLAPHPSDGYWYKIQIGGQDVYDDHDFDTIFDPV